MQTVDSPARWTFTSAEGVLAGPAEAAAARVDLTAMSMEGPSKHVEWAWLMTSLQSVIKLSILKI